MNLFVTDLDPAIAATHLDDKRLRKMVLETAQMLCTVGWKDGGAMPYKPTHSNHPVVLAMDDINNFRWVCRYFHELACEYELRFNKQHASYITVRPYIYFPIELHSTTFANCARNNSLNLDFTRLPVPLSYRAYLSARWAQDKLPPIWTGRTPPDWRHCAEGVTLKVP